MNASTELYRVCLALAYYMAVLVSAYIALKVDVELESTCNGQPGHRVTPNYAIQAQLVQGEPAMGGGDA